MDNNEKILIETEARSKSNAKRIDTMEKEIEEIRNLIDSYREV